MARVQDFNRGDKVDAQFMPGRWVAGLAVHDVKARGKQRIGVYYQGMVYYFGSNNVRHSTPRHTTAINTIKRIINVNHQPWTPERYGYTIKREGKRILVDACGFGGVTGRHVYLDSLEMDLRKAQAAHFFLMHRNSEGIWVE